VEKVGEQRNLAELASHINELLAGILRIEEQL
jgi:hypothetical protein